MSTGFSFSETAMVDAPSSTFLHPASGILILGLDWILFSGSVLSLGLSAPALGVLGLLLGTVGTGWLQATYGRDSRLKSLLKGLLGGLVVGVPLPIAGTAVGGAVLALSGLNQLTTGSNRDESDSDRLSSDPER